MKKESLNHTQTPIYSALCRYEASQQNSLHVPGHKDGRVFDRHAHPLFQEILYIDVTSSRGIDKLNDPRSFIKEAQTLAADAFGADHTYFLIGGSSVGNLAAALTLCDVDDEIIVQRNMHKSVFNGLLLAGAKPIYIASRIESQTEAALISQFSYIEKALQAHPSAKAVWVTNPNYYGMSQNLSKLADMCHKHHIPLIVDEAHGAHFGQHEQLPPSALQCGADLVIQSTHKMLTALTMGSMMHLQGSLVERAKLTHILAILQSSSPSYPILASLDLARRHLVQEGRNALSRSITCLEEYASRLNQQFKNLSIWMGSDEVDFRDPLRWIVSCKNHSISGYQLEELFHQYGATSELSDPFNTLFLFSIFEEEKTIQRIANIMLEIDELITLKQWASTPNRVTVHLDSEGLLKQAEMSLHDAFYAPLISLPLQQSVGKICGEMVIPYPPGIPLLIPGEIITSDLIAKITNMVQLNCYFENPSDQSMATIKVIR